MKSIAAPVVAILLLSMIPTSAAAKESTIGIYAVIDQVTFDQEGPSPNVVRISGIFTIPVPSASGFYYRIPQRGYLYFRIPPGGEQAARNDWKKLKTFIGTGQVVGFASYWTSQVSDSGGSERRPLEVRIHKDSDDASPEVYPVSHPKGVITAGDKDVSDFDERIAAQLQVASRH